MLSNSVLVVEDDPVLGELLESILRRSGFGVLLAADAMEAIRIWEETEAGVPVALLDLTLPGAMNGASLAVRFKSDAPSLNVIMMSGRFMDSDLVQERITDAVFLQKPFSASDLVRIVRSTFERTGGP
jgi:DNA-binding response OmpR family regulator